MTYYVSHYCTDEDMGVNLIEQQAAEIERLHICATCKYWIKLSNGCENMAGPVIKNRLDKCNNWDVAEQND